MAKVKCFKIFIITSEFAKLRFEFCLSVMINCNRKKYYSKIFVEGCYNDEIKVTCIKGVSYPYHYRPSNCHSFKLIKNKIRKITKNKCLQSNLIHNRYFLFS